MLVPVVEPVFVKNPQWVLDMARAAYTTGFSARLNKITHWLYQRSAPAGYVYATHKAWGGKLSLLTTEIADTAAKVEEACQYLIAKGRTQERSGALKSLLYLQTLAGGLMQKCQRLSLLLASEPYAAAVEYFNIKVAECSAIATKLKVEERVQALFEMLTEVDQKRSGVQDALKNEPPVVIEEAKSVYEDAVQFAAYTGRFFTLEVMAVPDLRKKIEALLMRLGGSQGEYELAPLPAYPRMMPNENYFRNGQWFATWSYIGYSQIASQIYALQNIAEALYVQECSQNARVQLVCEGSKLEDDPVIRCDYRPHIVQQLQLLQAMVPSQTVHAGWNYVAGLLSHAGRVSAQNIQLEEMLSGEFSLQVVALQRVVHFFAIKETSRLKGDRVYELCSLYEALCALTAGKREGENRFFALLSNTFYAEAVLSLECSAEEKTYSAMLLEGDAVWSYAPGVFQSYLMAGFLRRVYFEQTDQQFHAVLAKLKDDPSNKDGFARCLAGSKECRELYEAYAGL